ncbi:hypothetical protein BGX30_013646 [Mortierella sp. GBA39]|nr:hypothetical protein BGX30_013646 [Mortierella sp. GBA39]
MESRSSLPSSSLLARSTPELSRLMDDISCMAAVVRKPKLQYDARIPNEIGELRSAIAARNASIQARLMRSLNQKSINDSISNNGATTSTYV